MKRLLLLRHAKTVPGGPGIDDHARELTPRGRSDAQAMGRYMRKNGLEPDLMLSSTSRRTVETVQLAVVEFKAKPTIEYLAPLYLAEARTVASVAKSAPEEATCVCIVGHNPGLELCATHLARHPVKRKERGYRDAIEEKFPTGALAVLDFDVGSWRDIEPGTGVLVDFVRPRDL